MSKSLGNLISATDFIKLHGVDTLRYIFLTTSYSSPIDLSANLIETSKEQVERFAKMFRKSQLFFSNLEFPSEMVLDIFRNIAT